MCQRETWNMCGELIEECCSHIIIYFFVLIFALIFALIFTLINIISTSFQVRIVNLREYHYLQRQFQRLANHHLHIMDKLSLPGTCLHQLFPIISTRQSIYLLASYNTTKKNTICTNSLDFSAAKALSVLYYISQKESGGLGH